MQQTADNIFEQNQQKTLKRIFHTEYEQILTSIDDVDPVKYGYTRNHINGAVTYLSPYISRGVISTRMVLDKMITRGFKLYQIESFVKELCWRDYFQRLAQVRNLNQSIKYEQSPVAHHEIPESIVNASTGIEAIDNAIHELYETGYMHNHCRMYKAFLTCNLGRAHWLQPARWMYYHLLDGDWASNACSWQWVCGANSSKKYYANQDNINKYTGSTQIGTYLDKSYEDIASDPIPIELAETIELQLNTVLPETDIRRWNENAHAFVYNYYNMDPLWHRDDIGNRVLLLDPQIFKQYPVSAKSIDFLLNLCINIPDMQIFTGSFDELTKQYPAHYYYYKEHPLNIGYNGKEEPRDWIVPDVAGYHPSFFAYWKKAERNIKRLF